MQLKLFSQQYRLAPDYKKKKCLPIGPFRLSNTVAPGLTNTVNKMSQHTGCEEKSTEILFHCYTWSARDFGEYVFHFIEVNKDWKSRHMAWSSDFFTGLPSDDREQQVWLRVSRKDQLVLHDPAHGASTIYKADTVVQNRQPD